MSDKIPHTKLNFDFLTKDNIPDSFNCRKKDFNNFLLCDAIQHQKDSLARTILFYHDEKVVGYASLLADAISFEPGKLEELEEYDYPFFPAMKIGRLAVDKEYEDRGIGSFILVLVIAICKKLQEVVGIRFITVDAYKTKKAQALYAKFRFDKNGIKNTNSTVSMHRDMNKLKSV